jgi:glycogen(starch) synthase
VRILVCAESFPPATGGTETVTNVVVRGLASLGHEVVLATRAQVERSSSFEVVVNPTAFAFRQLARRVDVVWHSQFAPTFSWPLLGTGIPAVVTHHTWPVRNVRSRVKQLLLAGSQQVAVSTALAGAFPGAAVIANPYDDSVFGTKHPTPESGNLAFVGRLFEGKGADLAINALKILHDRGHDCHLSIIGDGPEREALGELARNSGVADRVRFHGSQQPAEVARLLRLHTLLLIPSRRSWSEPFGVVALEGIACGCIPVGTRYGGLPEAIGDCGPLCDETPESVSDAAEPLLTSPERRLDFRRGAPAHLERHSALTVSRAYERAFERVLGERQ